jgi:hypothetical protein
MEAISLPHPEHSGTTAAMSSIWRSILPLTLAMGLCAFQAPAPQRTPPPSAPPVPISTVSATLKVSGADIVAMLNERTRTQLARVEGQEVNCLIQKCQLDLTATRTGEITGFATGSGMQLKLPFALHAHLDFDSKYVKTGGDAVAQGEAVARTQLALQPNWRVDSHTDGDVHLSDAKLKLGPLKMSVAKLWNASEDKLSQPIFKAIDKRIAAAFKIHGPVERFWRKLLQPIRIGKDPDSWLVLSPQHLRITPLTTENEVLVIALAADVRARVIVGTPPAPPATPVKLPPPEPLHTRSNEFRAAVPISLSYGDAVRIAMEKLKKKPLHVGKTQVRIDKLQILPSGQDLVVAARFCVVQSWDFTHLLDSCGDVYLHGAPQFDANTNTIRIVNLHYDIATENLMLKLMHALAGDELGKALEQHLVFDESREVSKLKNQISAALAKSQGRGIAITGKIDSFGDPKLSWTNGGFLALVTATGTVSAGLSMKPPH